MPPFLRALGLVGVAALAACDDDPTPDLLDDAGADAADPPGGDGDGDHGGDGDGDDAGGDGDHTGDPSTCFEGLTAPEVSFVEVQAFASPEHGVQITRARQPGMRSAVGETFPYDLVRVAVVVDDDAACITQASQLTYEFGHHNWNEVWSVTTDKARYVGREMYGFDDPEQPWTDTLEARSLDGDELLWGPVSLSDEGCYSLPYDLNPCMRRTRVDEPPPGWGE